MARAINQEANLDKGYVFTIDQIPVYLRAIYEENHDSEIETGEEEIIMSIQDLKISHIQSLIETHSNSSFQDQILNYLLNFTKHYGDEPAIYLVFKRFDTTTSNREIWNKYSHCHTSYRSSVYYALYEATVNEEINREAFIKLMHKLDKEDVLAVLNMLSSEYNIHVQLTTTGCRIVKYVELL